MALANQHNTSQRVAIIQRVNGVRTAVNRERWDQIMKNVNETVLVDFIKKGKMIYLEAYHFIILMINIA